MSFGLITRQELAQALLDELDAKVTNKVSSQFQIIPTATIPALNSGSLKMLSMKASNGTEDTELGTELIRQTTGGVNDVSVVTTRAVNGVKKQSLTFNYDGGFLFTTSGNGPTQFTSEANILGTVGTTMSAVGSKNDHKLDIYDSNNQPFALREISDADGASVRLFRARGSKSALGQVKNGDEIGSIRAVPYLADINSWGTSSALIRFQAEEDVTNANRGTSIIFSNTPNGYNGMGERMRIHPNGYVGIGVSNPRNTLHLPGSGMQIGDNQSDPASNFHIVADNQGSEPGLRFYTGNYGSGARVFNIQKNGKIHFGSEQKVFDTEGWSRVFDMHGGTNSMFRLRTNTIDSRVAVHDNGWWGGPGGLIVGTGTNHPISFATNSTTTMFLNTDGFLNFIRKTDRQDSGIWFQSRSNGASDFATVRYFDDINSYAYWGDSSENSALIIEVGNDGRNASSDVVVLKSPAAVIIDSDGFRIPTLPYDPGNAIAGMIWLRSDM
ncbi:hypothetical protein D3C74_50940 [compost metagenome]